MDRLLYPDLQRCDDRDAALLGLAHPEAGRDAATEMKHTLDCASIQCCSVGWFSADLVA